MKQKQLFRLFIVFAGIISLFIACDKDDDDVKNKRAPYFDISTVYWSQK